MLTELIGQRKAKILSHAHADRHTAHPAFPGMPASTGAVQ